MSNTVFLYARHLSAENIAAFAQQTQSECLQQAVYLGYQIAFFKSPKPAVDLRALASEFQADIADLAIAANLQQAGLLVMDMDSTAIKIECIDEIAKLAGTGELVSQITAAAMRGELDFEQSLRQRVGTLKDAPETILQKVRENLPLMEGFEDMVAELKRYDWKLAIASGGFTYFADYLKETHGLDYATSNQFEIIDGKLTGKVLGKVVDAQHKADTLKMLGERFQIPAQQWVAIGDGANDLPMIHTASLGVALHAKPKVQAQAKFVVNFGDLTALCVLLNANHLFNA